MRNGHTWGKHPQKHQGRGTRLRKIPRPDAGARDRARSGDLVFFRRVSRHFSHVLALL
jgi:cell wall-associated NlpC family hydrolase